MLAKWSEVKIPTPESEQFKMQSIGLKKKKKKKSNRKSFDIQAKPATVTDMLTVALFHFLVQKDMENHGTICMTAMFIIGISKYSQNNILVFHSQRN